MPAETSALFDTLLVLAGLVLVVTGLVMFIRSKTSTQASSVEAFGIKLNVTHPSLILVLAGVGLMLAPRLLPEPVGKAGQPESAVVAEAPVQPAEAPAQPAVPPPLAKPEPPPQPVPPSTPPTASAPALPSARSPAAPASVPSVQPAQPERLAPPAKPHRAAPSTPKQAATQTAAVRPAPAAPAAPSVSAMPPATETPATPSPPTRTARPKLVYAALGLPISRSFWSGETPAGYTRRMNAVLQQAGRDVLSMDALGIDLGQAEFNAWWNESRQHPRSRELCAGSNSPRALLAARVETPTTISSVESAYWPELKLRLFVCANQKLYRQQKTLAPQIEDAWPFASELNSEIERFMRTYRGDLAE